MTTNHPQLSSTHLQPIQNRWAFLVGVDAYIEPNFRRLKFCVKDVTALEALLKAVGYTVVALYDEHSNQHRRPTLDNVRAELLQLCSVVGPDDLLFVHFACHGKLHDKQAVLMMHDSRNALLDRPEKRLTVTDVETMMRGSGSSRLMLSLDACHMGVEVGRDVSDLEFIRNVHELAEGFVLLAGSTAQQKAQEWNQVQHGVYTYFLLEALSGKASRMGQSFVTVDDVKLYILNGLRRWLAENSGLIQEPTARVEGLGDMILADWRESQTKPVFPLGPKLIDDSSVVQPRDTIRGTRSEFRERQLARKREELAAVEQDLETCPSKKQELKLKRDAEQILQEIEELESNN